MIIFHQEYNPGGGKDEVKKYLDESEKQVIIAEKALKTIIDILQLWMTHISFLNKYLPILH